MSALAEALLAAQRGTLAAMQRAYLAGALDDDDGFVEVMNRIGCTDTVEQGQYLFALETMRGLGVQLPATNGAAPKEAKPASEAQWKLIRRLADERGQVAPEGPLTLEQASQVIEELRKAMRSNMPYPVGGPVRFVGGLPQRHFNNAGDPEYVHQGEAVGTPFFSDGTTWIRVRVPGQPDDVLVPVENLRP